MDLSNDSDSVDAAVAAAIDGYVPALFDADAYPLVVAEMRRLVGLAAPVSVNDAALMFASLSRLVADSLAMDGSADLDRVLTEDGVRRWRGWALANGAAASTVGNHVGKLKRFLRIKRGLPARMELRGQPKTPLVGFDWVAAIETVRPDRELVAALVVAVGAGCPASSGVGATVTAGTDGGPVVVLGDGESVPVLSALCEVAVTVVGVKVGAGAWDRLRKTTPVTARSARATFSALAGSESLSFRDVLGRYGLTRRDIDAAVSIDTTPIETDELRLLLR